VDAGSDDGTRTDEHIEYKRCFCAAYYREADPVDDILGQLWARAATGSAPAYLHGWAALGLDHESAVSRGFRLRSGSRHLYEDLTAAWLRIIRRVCADCQQLPERTRCAACQRRADIAVAREALAASLAEALAAVTIARGDLDQLTSPGAYDADLVNSLAGAHIAARIAEAEQALTSALEMAAVDGEATS
jgi:hypothetical protein